MIGRLAASSGSFDETLQHKLCVIGFGGTSGVGTPGALYSARSALAQLVPISPQALISARREIMPEWTSVNAVARTLENSELQRDQLAVSEISSGVVRIEISMPASFARSRV
jgi:hypothetical protein